MFLREAQPRIDVDFGTRTDGFRALDQVKYASKLRAGLKQAFRAAQEASQKSANTNKQRYEPTTGELQLGYRVLVRNVGLKGPHKLADRWSSQPYIVRNCMEHSLSVYDVQLEDRGRTSRLHHNMLLPIGEPTYKDRKNLRITRHGLKALESPGGVRRTPPSDQRLKKVMIGLSLIL